MPINLSPLNDSVLIKPDPPPDYSTFKGYTHIIVPDKYEHGPEDRPVWGIVMAKGPSCKDVTVEVGSHVVFGKWAGARIKQYLSHELILVRESDLLAIDA